MKKIVSLLIICSLLFVSSSLVSCKGKESKVITVGSSNFTEVIILGNIYQQLIEEHTDIKVKTSFGLNGAVFCFESMKKKNIDMFVEYSGSMLTNICKQPINTNVDEVYQTIKKMLKEEHNVVTSKPLGFNNSYIMAVKQETAEKYNLETLSDLMRTAPELRLGCTMEFVQREDCLPSLEREFNTKFKEVHGLDASVRYSAIEKDNVEVIDAFMTDALLVKQGLTVLEDDVSFFPPYYACNFIRQETLDKYPELIPVLEKLDGKITGEIMSNMNMQVDIEGRDASDVAKEFLQSIN